MGCQFSFVCDGSMRRGKEPGAWRKARDIAARALGGYVMADVGNSTHFHTTGVSPSWRNHLLRVAQVGTHVFYRFGGRAGGSDAFRYTPRPSTGFDSVQPVYASVIPTQRNDAAPAPYTILFNGQGGPTAEQASEPASASSATPAAAPAKPEAAPAAPAAVTTETTAD